MGPDPRAAQPLLRLVTSDAAEYRDLTRTTMLGRGLRRLLTGRLRRRHRMPMDVTILEEPGTGASGPNA